MSAFQAEGIYRMSNAGMTENATMAAIMAVLLISLGLRAAFKFILTRGSQLSV